MIRISPQLELPLEAVTQTFAILAKRGVGKTYTALVLAEELLDANQTVCIVDPIGVCWGLRSSADGKSAGYPIVVMGGEHGDVPLEEAAGETIADFLVDERQSCVLDLSLFRKRESVRFVTAFAERLYHRNRKAMHLILDEADAVAPQKPMKEQARMLGAVEDIVRRGRARGLGVTLVTQRAAVLNKNVLTQIESLFVLRTLSPQDRKAMEAWIVAHDAEHQRESFMETLATLPIGTAWFWSPGWLDIFEKIQIRKRRTFDSSATPKAGAKSSISGSAKKLADVDLEALKTRIASTIEKAKANDPRELKKRIAELERELRVGRKPVEPSSTPAKVERVEVQVLGKAELRRLESSVGRMEKAIGPITKALADVSAALARVSRNGHAARAANTRAPLPPRRTEATKPSSPASTMPPTSQPASLAVSSSQQRILDALAFFLGIGIHQVERTQLALMADASPTSGGYFNNLGSLRSAGLVDYPAPKMVSLTSQGAALATGDGAPRTSEELHQRVRAKLPAPKWKLLEHAIAHYPDSISRDELAELAGVSATSGGYFNNLGSLRSLGLIGYPEPGQVIALPVLFLET